MKHFQIFLTFSNFLDIFKIFRRFQNFYTFPQFLKCNFKFGFYVLFFFCFFFSKFCDLKSCKLSTTISCNYLARNTEGPCVFSGPAVPAGRAATRFAGRGGAGPPLEPPINWIRSEAAERDARRVRKWQWPADQRRQRGNLEVVAASWAHGWAHGHARTARNRQAPPDLAWPTLHNGMGPARRSRGQQGVRQGRLGGGEATHWHKSVVPADGYGSCGLSSLPAGAWRGWAWPGAGSDKQPDAAHTNGNILLV